MFDGELAYNELIGALVASFQRDIVDIPTRFAIRGRHIWHPLSVTLVQAMNGRLLEGSKCQQVPSSAGTSKGDKAIPHGVIAAAITVASIPRTHRASASVLSLTVSAKSFSRSPKSIMQCGLGRILLTARLSPPGKRMARRTFLALSDT